MAERTEHQERIDEVITDLPVMEEVGEKKEVETAGDYISYGGSTVNSIAENEGGVLGEKTKKIEEFDKDADRRKRKELLKLCREKPGEAVEYMESFLSRDRFIPPSQVDAGLEVLKRLAIDNYSEGEALLKDIVSGEGTSKYNIRSTDSEKFIEELDLNFADLSDLREYKEKGKMGEIKGEKFRGTPFMSATFLGAGGLSVDLENFYDLIIETAEEESMNLENIECSLLYGDVLSNGNGDRIPDELGVMLLTGEMDVYSKDFPDFYIDIQDNEELVNHMKTVHKITKIYNKFRPYHKDGGTIKIAYRSPDHFLNNPEEDREIKSAYKSGIPFTGREYFQEIMEESKGSRNPQYEFIWEIDSDGNINGIIESPKFIF